MHKILIANRGEIAVRVIRTARNQGLRTVAVYSEADAGALHVSEADQAVCIGPAGVGESYLRGENILAAAATTGADAIHPGYGFLSENADFARACEVGKLTFIGPPADAIELMGNKRLAKVAMLAAGVPCIPGYQDAEQSDAILLAKAGEMGFPLMVKASAGGGGRGMRLVWQASELAEQIITARSEAQNAFGSGELLLERAIAEPRHIEIQVFADNHGNVVYLGERDCSIQRRHQKVVEEAPSPFVDEALRRRMGDAAVNAARSCAYRGAGTVEFLVDSEKNFYFMEMNTRLQVEHPVTELITGQDLVAWQLMVAAGEPLPLTQDEIRLNGHAIEVRLYAEDPRNNFIPQTGQILRWDIPQRDGVRVDHGIQAGQIVSPHYDSMLAKIIAFGDNRQIACRRLASAVQDTGLLGVNNNKLFLQNVLRHPVFIEGDATTAFIDQHCSADASMAQTEPGFATLARAALVYYRRDVTDSSTTRLAHAWRSAATDAYQFRLQYAGHQYAAKLSAANDVYHIEVSGQSVDLQALGVDEGCCTIVENSVREVFYYAFDGDTLYLDHGCGHFAFTNITHKPAVAMAGAGSGHIKASMDGAIVAVLVDAGDTVEQGQTIIVLEAMKMEQQLKAAVAGVVVTVHTQTGQQVKSKQLLATIVASGG